MSSGGFAQFTTISDGVETVLAGGTSFYDTVSLGKLILSGGFAAYTTIRSGGSLTVSSGGHTTSTVISGGGSLIASAGVAYWSLSGKRTPLPALQAVPLTAYPGHENAPSFSPDGSQVAFSWNGEEGNNSDF